MLKQQLSQKLLQKLSPQQIQLMKLIQLPTQALEQRLQEEIETNPALEEGAEQEYDEMESATDEFEEDAQSIEAEDINVDEYLSDDEIPDYRLHANNYSKDDDDDYKVPITGGESFQDTLRQQLANLPLKGQDREIAEYLLGYIDDEGYLRRDTLSIVDDLAFNQNIFVEEEYVERILKEVQQMDPPGVGARDLQECLVLQIRQRKNTAAVKLAREILENHFEAFAKKHYEKLKEKLEITDDYLREAFDIIVKLNPKPGGASVGRAGQEVIPDFAITIKDGELDLSLNGRNAPELNVSREYKDMLQSYKNSKIQNKAQKETVLFVKQKLDSAKWFIDAILQRQQTLMFTMSAIMNFQREYFLSGDERDLKPMILKDIAEEINMDISTVSRVASNKYVSTPYGTFLIKNFFSEGMKNEAGEDVSTREIKRILQDIVAAEDKRKPITDERLAQLLKEQGYPIARRTVAKYREQLDIPVGRLRKEI